MYLSQVGLHSTSTSVAQHLLLAAVGTKHNSTQLLFHFILFPSCFIPVSYDKLLSQQPRYSTVAPNENEYTFVITKPHCCIAGVKYNEKARDNVDAINSTVCRVSSLFNIVLYFISVYTLIHILLHKYLHSLYSYIYICNYTSYTYQICIYIPPCISFIRLHVMYHTCIQLIMEK